jgi:hypothetical protein
MWSRLDMEKQPGTESNNRKEDKCVEDQELK